jgi:hypothetical protein
MKATAMPTRRLFGTKAEGKMSQLWLSQVNLRTKLKSIPWFFLPVARFRESSKKTLIRKSTDIVIEGFWRCGNHFATCAFMSAQKQPLHIAHHFHAPAQLVAAAKWRVPAILLIRNPIDVIASSNVYLNVDDPAAFLQSYIAFHRVLEPWSNELVISDFSTTVSNFGSVIESVNTKFGRDFTLFQHNEESESVVAKMIHDEHAENMGGGEGTLPLPTEEKNRRKQTIKEQLKGSEYADLVAEADATYLALKKVAV